MTTIALVGIDGAGKSTIASLVAARLGVPARVVYMGVNVETSSVMLPTTRLLLAVKRRRGGRPDLVANFGRSRTERGIRAAVIGTTRLVAWLSEEWFRQAIAWWHEARGRVVIFDRHFTADYHAQDVARPAAGRPWASRIHGLALDRLYPRPDLVICLDGPAATFQSRRTDIDAASVDALEARRREYLDLAEVVPQFAIVDATLPLDEVVAAVTSVASAFVARQGADIEPTTEPSPEQGVAR
jgi:thymidylate kinase